MSKRTAHASDIKFFGEDEMDRSSARDWPREIGDNPRQVMERVSRQLEEELDKAFGEERRK